MKFQYPGSAVLLACCTLVHGQDGAEQPYSQEPMVVTTSRWHERSDESLSAVTLIDRATIVASQAADLLDLLRDQAGIDIARQGGPGSQASLFLRGTNSNHTLVLIDGIRVGSPHSGAFAWEHLPIDQIERVEIVRGPRAAYYGSDAIGGVIHIITRRVRAPHLHVEYGGDDAFRASAGLAAGDADQRLRVTTAYRDVGGFSAQNEDGFGFDPDDDGYRSRSVTAGYDRRVGSQQVDLQLAAVDADVEFDQGESATRRYQLSGRLDGALGSDWRHELRLGALDEELTTPAFFSRFDTRRGELDWQLDYLGAADHTLTAGVNLVAEEGASRETFGNTAVYDESRHNRAMFAGWRWQPLPWELELSLRHDDDSEFGGHTTGQLTIGGDLGAAWRGWLSHGTAFRAPSLSQQFSPGFGGQFAGNPALEPETSRTTEAGVRYRPGGGHALDLAIYRTRIDDLIDFAGPQFMAINVAQAAIDGLEADYRWRGSDWMLGATLTLQDAEDGAGSPLLRRADQKLALSAVRSFGDAAELGIAATHVGARADFGAELDSYQLLELRGRWPLSRRWMLEGRVENLLDEDYSLAFGFNTQGRAVYAGLRYRP